MSMGGCHNERWEGKREGGLVSNWEGRPVSWLVELVIGAWLVGRGELYDILTNSWMILIAKLPLCLI